MNADFAATDRQAAAESLAGTPIDLVASMQFDPAEGVADLDGQLDRLAARASRLDFACNRHDLRNALQAATFRLQQACSVNLRLSPLGSIAIETRVSNHSAPLREVPGNKEFLP